MYEGFSSFLSQTVSSEKNKNLQVSRLFSRYKKLQRRRKVLSPRCSAGAKTGSSRREPVIAPAEHPGAACAPSPFLVERALGVLARQRLEHRVGLERRLPDVREDLPRLRVGLQCGLLVPGFLRFLTLS